MCQEPTELLWIGCLKGGIWNPKIQIRHIDTKHQIADILTKGNFTRDEWNNLLHLSLSLLCQKFQLGTQRTAKRMQEQKEENRIVAKSRATAMTLVCSVSYKFFICEQSDCVEKPGDTQNFKSTG